MKKKPNFEKVSVSLPPEVHEWLKAEAQRRTQEYGENWSVSRIIQEAMREYRTRTTAHSGQTIPDARWILNEPGNYPPQSNVIQPSSETSAGGSSTPPITRYRKIGKAK